MLLHLFSFECGAEEEVVIVLSTIIYLSKGSFITFSLRKIFLNLFQTYLKFLKGASNANWVPITLSSSREPLLISNYSTEMRTLF